MKHVWVLLRRCMAADKQNAVARIIITLFTDFPNVEYQIWQFWTDTGSVASELPSEQDKTEELKDKPETL